MEKFVKIINGRVSIVEPDITKDDFERLCNGLLVNNHIFNVESDSDVELLTDLCFSIASHVYQAISGNTRLSKMLSVSGSSQQCKSGGLRGCFSTQGTFASLAEPSWKSTQTCVYVNHKVITPQKCGFGSWCQPTGEGRKVTMNITVKMLRRFTTWRTFPML
jgi:hypothetical protein